MHLVFRGDALETLCFKDMQDSEKLRLEICALICSEDTGKPNVEKNFSNAFTTKLVVIMHNGTASGKRVEAHMMVSKY